MNIAGGFVLVQFPNHTLDICKALMDAPFLNKGCLVIRNEVVKLRPQSIC
jgi:hypothetical protein